MWEEIKNIGNLLMKAGNIELYKQLLDFQAEAQRHIEENYRLKEEIKELKGQLETTGELEFKNNQYFRAINGKKYGPYCSCCWDRDYKLINLHVATSSGYSDCPSCKTRIYHDENSSSDDYNNEIKSFYEW